MDTTSSARRRIIDCDLHPCLHLDSQGDLAPYLTKEHQLLKGMNLTGAPGHGYGNPKGTHLRDDCRFSSPEDFESGYLEPYGITFAVLAPQPTMDFGLMHSLDVANIYCQAGNDWLLERYLARSSRYLGSICINANDPQAAAREIDRLGGHPQMVQVLVPGAASFLYGHRFYHPIYQACERHGLVFAIHPGAEGVYGSSTSVGRPSSYLEWHTSLSQTFMAHTASLVLEGTFERFPGLQVLLTEGGYGWLPHLMWRMDKNFKGLRASVPWLKEAPSAYIRRHVKLTTQPLEEAPQPRHALEMMEMIYADETLCFSSDYPHWDFDDPFRAFPSQISPELKERILWGNAYDLYATKLATLVKEEMGGAV